MDVADGERDRDPASLLHVSAWVKKKKMKREKERERKRNTKNQMIFFFPALKTRLATSLLRL